MSKKKFNLEDAIQELHENEDFQMKVKQGINLKPLLSKKRKSKK